MERPGNILRAVAELKGFTFERREMPSGRHIHLYHNSNGQWSPDDLPQWHSSLDDAILLFDDVSDDWTPRLVRMHAPRGDHMGYTWKACLLNNETHEQLEVEMGDPAEAICLVWLMYKNIGR